MSVIPITVFLSLGLVFIFVALFWREQRRRRFASAERDSLLPLAEETPRLVTADKRLERELRARFEHVRRPRSTPGHASAGCGCERGERPPCADCLRQAAPAVHPAL